MGLRERKKLQTRQALGRAALRLAVERGPENVLVEDIAAAVGVSPRTFNNYFSSKAEAIAAHHADRGRELAERVRRRPLAESVWESVLAAALAQYDSGADPPDQQWRAGVRLMVSEPALIGEFLRAGSVVERELAQAIAERTRTDATTDLYPKLVAASVGAAIEVATHQWLTADPPVPLGALVQDALTRVAAGLPEPSTS
ncbi:TetR family transcriptional regulator [Catellatospora bangladeshensis]